MTDEELALWLARHGGEVGRKNNERLVAAHTTPDGDDVPASRVIDSTTVEAQDGATITLRRQNASPPGGVGPRMDETTPDYERVAETPPDKSKQGPQQTPEQQQHAQNIVREDDEKWRQQVQENNEKSWNLNDPAGSGKAETHAERAAREQKEAQQARADAAEARQQASLERQAAADESRNRESAADRAERARQADQANALNQERNQLDRDKFNREGRKPDFLSQANDKNPYIVRYDPQSGEIIKESNPNYDAVQVEAERKRAELELQIRNRSVTLEEAKAQYSQWFDTNVKTPLMLAQEARAQAEEKRQALEAEERRKQFAADFGLRKATLGQQAGQAAVQNEISLLPYRAGPTEAAEMSSAINSLAAGGKIDGPDASAGIHFTPGAFEFNRPDFKSIAKEATKAALGGLTDYRPSDQEFPTANYSGVPQVNLAGAPTVSSGGGTYQYPYPTPPTE
jgi:hypothetical protein